MKKSVFRTSLICLAMIFLSAAQSFAQNNNTQNSNTQPEDAARDKQIEEMRQEVNRRLKQSPAEAREELEREIRESQPQLYQSPQPQQQQQPYSDPVWQQQPYYQQPQQPYYDEQEQQRELKRQAAAEKKQQIEQQKQFEQQKKADEIFKQQQADLLQKQQLQLQQERDEQERTKQKETRAILTRAASFAAFQVAAWLLLFYFAFKERKGGIWRGTQLMLGSVVVTIFVLLLFKIIYGTDLLDLSSYMNFGRGILLIATIYVALMAFFVGNVWGNIGLIKLTNGKRNRLLAIGAALIWVIFCAVFSTVTITAFYGVITGFLTVIIAAVMTVAGGSKSARETESEREKRHGSARFITDDEIKSSFVLTSMPEGANPSLPPGAFFLAPFKKNEAIALNWQDTGKHGIILGGTGTGKSRGFFLYNCASVKDTSLVVTDPKSELWNMTSGYHSKSIRYAPTDPEHSEGFNWIPLCKSARMAELCARALIESGNTGKTEQFWIDAETAFLSAIFAHVSTLPRPTPLTAYRFFTRQSPHSVLEQLLESESEAAQEQAIVFEQTDEKIKGSIVPAIAAKMQFLRDDATARFTSSQLFAPDFSVLKRVPQSIYYCLREQDIVRLKPLTSLFFTVMLEQLAATEGDESANVPVLMTLDEFANIGKFPAFETTITLARGRGVGLWLGVQSLSQIKALYGEQNGRTIISNCMTKVALHGLDIETAEYISKSMGDKTETFSKFGVNFGMGVSVNSSPEEVRRALLTPSEVTTISSDEVLIISGNKPPLRAKKGYFDNPAPPAVQRGLGEALSADFQMSRKQNGNGSRKNVMYEID
jgi:type IV secretion system protein VirD4